MQIFFYYYPPKNRSDFGHVALGIVNESYEECYISYWPEGDKSSRVTEMNPLYQRKEEDFLAYEIIDFKLRLVDDFKSSEIEAKELLIKISKRNFPYRFKVNSEEIYKGTLQNLGIEDHFFEKIGNQTEKKEIENLLNFYKEYLVIKIKNNHNLDFNFLEIIDLSQSGFDIDKILSEYKKIIENKGLKYWLLSHCDFGLSNAETCTSLLRKLLNHGGFKKILPFGSDFSSFNHSILIFSTNIFLGISLISDPLHRILERDQKENLFLSETFLTMVLNSFIVFIMEFIDENFIKGKKDLSKLNFSDWIIGLLSSIGFFLPDVLSRRFIISGISNKPVCFVLPIDLFVLFFIVPSIAIINKIGNWLFYFFSKSKGHVNAPAHLFNEIKHIINIRNKLGNELTYSLFRKQYFFLSVIIFSYCFVYLMRKLQYSHTISLLAGIFSGAILGYFFVKILTRNDQKIIDSYKGDEAISECIKEYDKSIADYAVSYSFTLGGITASTTLISNFNNISVILKIVISCIGAIIGYPLGRLVSVVFNKIFTKKNEHESLPLLLADNKTNNNSIAYFENIEPDKGKNNIFSTVFFCLIFSFLSFPLYYFIICDKDVLPSCLFSVDVAVLTFFACYFNRNKSCFKICDSFFQSKINFFYKNNREDSLYEDSRGVYLIDQQSGYNNK